VLKSIDYFMIIIVAKNVLKVVRNLRPLDDVLGPLVVPTCKLEERSA
jgi:hypothetical protein